MQQQRPRLHTPQRPIPTTDEKVAALQKGAAATSGDLADVKSSLSDLTDTVGDQGAALDALGGTVGGLSSDLTALTSTVSGHSTAIAGLPATATIWSDARPTATFGTGSDLTWTGSGNGSAVTFNIPGRISTAPTRYVVIVGGVLQPADAYTLSPIAATLTFGEAPPDGVSISIRAPFYGSST